MSRRILGVLLLVSAASTADPIEDKCRSDYGTDAAQVELCIRLEREIGALTAGQQTQAQTHLAATPYEPRLELKRLATRQGPVGPIVMVRTNPIDAPVLDEDYDVFRTTDPNVYAQVLYDGLKPGQEIAFRWTALESEESVAVGPIGTRTLRIDNGRGYAAGWITTEDMPPQGTYRVEVLLDGTLVQARDVRIFHPDRVAGQELNLVKTGQRSGAQPPASAAGPSQAGGSPSPAPAAQVDCMTAIDVDACQREQEERALAELETAVAAPTTTLDSSVRGQGGSSSGVGGMTPPTAGAGGFVKGVGPITLHTEPPLDDQPMPAEVTRFKPSDATLYAMAQLQGAPANERLRWEWHAVALLDGTRDRKLFEKTMLIEPDIRYMVTSIQFPSLNAKGIFRVDLYLEDARIQTRQFRIQEW